jgi:hypothetical protein
MWPPLGEASSPLKSTGEEKYVYGCYIFLKYEIVRAGWAKANLEYVVRKTIQHTLEHVNDLPKNVLIGIEHWSGWIHNRQHMVFRLATQQSKRRGNEKIQI